MRTHQLVLAASLTVGLLSVPSAGGASESLTVMMVTEDGALHAYDPTTVVPPAEEGGEVAVDRQTLVAPGDGSGLHPLGEICQDPGSENRIVVGQGGDAPGWSILELSGTTVGAIEVTVVGALTPASIDPTPFGCRFLPDGRLVTSVSGNRDASSPAMSGELILWFPPLGDGGYCKLLTGIGNAGGVEVTGDGTILFTAAKAGATYSVTGTLPATVGDCTPDANGVPTASGLVQTPFITDAESSVPWDISPGPLGGWLISNPHTGTITEYDEDGVMVRRAVGNGSSTPYGYLEDFTPYGHALDQNGDLWIAHYGLTQDGPAPDGGAQLHVAPLSTRNDPDPSGDRNFIAGSGSKTRVTRAMNRTQGIGRVTIVAAAAAAGTSPAPDPDPTPAPAPAPAAAEPPMPTTGGGAAAAGLAIAGAALWLRRRR